MKAAARRALPGVVALAACVAAAVLSAQVDAPMYRAGQNIAPAYEGWARNPDGSFSLVFGYMNRNWDEAISLPVGPDNRFEPGEADRGQPTFFLPRRNFFLFRVRVPPDFGESELVWTLTSHGVTERAYGTLRSGYMLNDDVMTATLGAVGPGVTTADVSRLNTAPTVRLEGAASRTVKAGDTITLAAQAGDDGIPKPVALPPFFGTPAASALGTLQSNPGLRVAWFVYRGDGRQVTFDPPQFKVYVDVRGGSPWSPGWVPPPVPAGNRWVTRITFARPGAYVLRCLAHDGALAAYEDVVVTVN